MAISYIDSTIKAEQSGVAGVTQTGTTPVGVASGDLIVISTAASLATMPVWSSSTVTNWTVDMDMSQTSMLGRFIWRIADGSANDNPPAITTTAAAHRVTVVAVYRGIDTATPFIAKNGQIGTVSQASQLTPTLTNTDANSWGIYLGFARQVVTPLNWVPTSGVPTGTEREDQDTALATTNNTSGCLYDSNGGVAAQTVALGASTTFNTARSISWGAFLKPAAGGGATPNPPPIREIIRVPVLRASSF